MKKLRIKIGATWRWMRCLVLPWRVRYYAKDQRKMFRLKTHRNPWLAHYEDEDGVRYIFYELDMHKTSWQNMQDETAAYSQSSAL
jgi:hypothetical protein